MESKKKLCIRKRNGCVQQIPLYTDKADLKGPGGFVVVVDGKQLYADIAMKNHPHASALHCRKYRVEYAVMKKTPASEPDVLYLTEQKRIVRDNNELKAKMDKEEASLKETLKFVTDVGVKQKLRAELEDTQKLAICLIFKNTLYHQDLKAIPNVLDTSKLTTTSYMYYGCKDLATVDAIDTSNVGDMRGMFEGCTSLPSVFPYVIDLKGIKDVAMLHEMFSNTSVKKAYCMNAVDTVAHVLEIAKRKIGTSLVAAVPLSQDRYKMKDMHAEDYATATAFTEPYCCVGMTSLRGMFEGCAALKEVPRLDTKWITDFREMYKGCKSLPAEFPFLIDISAVKDPEMLRDMFKDSSVSVVQFSSDNEKLLKKITPELLGKTVDIRQAIKISDKVHTMKEAVPDSYRTMKKPYAFLKVDENFHDASDMFNGCAELETADDESLAAATSITNTRGMFQGCKNLKKIPKFTSTESLDTRNMFYGCESLTDIPLTLSTHETNTMDSMFYGCKNLPKKLDWILDANSVGYANAFDHMFAGTPVEEISIANLDHGVRKDMIFKSIGENIKTTKLYESINWINADSTLRYQKNYDRIVMWNDTPLEQLYCLTTLHELRFYGLTYLDDSIGAAVDLVSIDKVTGTDVAKSMRGMFSGCKSLMTLPPIDVKSIEDAYAMKDFIYGTKIETLYLVNASETLKSQLTPKLLGNMRLKIVYQ